MTNTNRQGGAALIIGLTLLMALTIIGIGTLSTTSLEHRMVGNMADTNVAFNTAESAARLFSTPITERFNMAGLSECGTRKTVFYCFNEVSTAYWWNDPDWWSKNPSLIHQEKTLTDSKYTPEVVIEKIKEQSYTLRMGHEYKPASRVIYYRLTTRARGLSDKAEAITQQIVKKKIN